MNLQESSSKLLTILPEVEKLCPVEHRFSDKVYIREIFMPQGLFIVGKTHRTKHFNIVLTGSCDVMINGEIKHIQAPCTFESLAGSQKTLYIHEDCRWMTVHVNEDNERNVEVLEERFIDADDAQPYQIIEKLKNIGGHLELGNNSSCSSR